MHAATLSFILKFNEIEIHICLIEIGIHYRNYNFSVHFELKFNFYMNSFSDAFEQPILDAGKKGYLRLLNELVFLLINLEIFSPTKTL